MEAGAMALIVNTPVAPKVIVAPEPLNVTGA
jgi:hypothetical protein